MWIKHALSIIASVALVACGSSASETVVVPPAASPESCAPDTSAIAHDADGNALSVVAAPIACATRTGFAGAESHIRVAPDGTVVEQPAVILAGFLGTGFIPGLEGPRPQSQLSAAGLAVSDDDGAGWKLVKPGNATWVASDASIYIDPVNGRLFFYGLAVNPAPQAGEVPLLDQIPSYQAHLLSSPDNGATWTVSSVPGFNNAENPRFTSAPAPAGQTQPVPGENVTYWCGNNMQFTFVARICYRSFDGGATWQQASLVFTRFVPQHSECGSSGEELATYDGMYPLGDPNGSLWLLVNCGGRSFLARSDDEASTFPILRTTAGDAPLEIPRAEELRVDTLGNLYAVHQNGAALELRTSTDGGQSWTEPRNVVAPAARSASVFQWATAIRAPGQLAVAYLAARAEGGYDGYVTLTHDALDPQPVFFSAAFNPSGTALVTSAMPAKDDYIDVDVGPDGSAWAAFYSDCVEADPTCSMADGPNPLGKATTVARLVFAE